MRSQASLFDGIAFLLLTSASMSLIFAFLGVYGTYQDNALRSAHTLSYLHAAMKAFYYLDISTLHDIKSEGIPVYADLDVNCTKLSSWRGKLSVAETIKKDLSDPTDVMLDDRYGAGAGAPFTPGKLAMRCAMKEVMKPYSYAGYRYFIDFIDERGVPLGRIPGSYPEPRITNSQLVTRNATLIGQGYHYVVDCEDAVHALEATNRTPALFAVSVPFRVLKETIEAPAGEPQRFIIRFCLWRE